VGSPQGAALTMAVIRRRSQGLPVLRASEPAGRAWKMRGVAPGPMEVKLPTSPGHRTEADVRMWVMMSLVR
jgi:hypothetical protein